MSKQSKSNEKRPDVLPTSLGSSVDSAGTKPPMASSDQGEGTSRGRGAGSTQQNYYCSPPYFSSSSSSSSSPDVRSPSEGRGAASRKYPEYKGRSKSGSTGTPLTPQEFELLSDSNPFKQDIAEKYGIAYPGITTRAHSSEFIGQAERQTGSENAEFSGLGRKKRSASVNDSVDSFTLDISTWKASSDKISRMCRGLNAFLLRNQESIEQSIASLDDTDVVIPTSEGAGVFSAPKKYDVVYVGKQNSCEDINSPVHDISPERLLDAELNEIQLEGKRASLQSSDSKDGLSSKFADDAVPSKQSSSMLPRPKQTLEQTKSDPYSAIKSEDVQRKKSGSKMFPGTQSGRDDSEDDHLSFERLTTRSFEESALVSQTSQGVSGETSREGSDRAQPFQQTKTCNNPSAFTSRNQDLLSFDDEGDSKVSGLSGRNKNSSISNKEEPLNSSQGHTQVAVRTTSNINTSPRSIDSGKKDQYQDTGDACTVKDNSAISPPHEILATFDPFASVEKPDKQAVHTASPDSQNMTEQPHGGKFSSSFYSVFSTTVSSLEDIDGHSDQRRADKTDTSPELHSSTWEAGDSTPSADSVFSIPSTGYERSVSEGSQGCKEPLNFSPGDLMSLKRSKKSEDSGGESSKESVSRDSMRVNLSQDSSVADLQDDPIVQSHLQVNGLPENGEDSLSIKPPVNTIQRPELILPQRHLDLASMLLPMAESASTDSMFVHVSTDSLHSATSGRSGEGNESELPDQRKLSDKSARVQLSIDLRRKNLMEQSRRRSLPASQFKNTGQGKLKSPILYASQSLDSTDTPEQQPLQRRSSVPVSRPRPNAARTLERIGSTSAPKLQYMESESEILEAAVEKPQTDINKTSDVTNKTDVSLDVSKLQPTSPPQAVSPSTARPRPSSKRGSVSGDKGVPVSINLGQVANILAGTTVASTQPTTTKVKTQKLQRTKIQFTIAAKAPEPNTTVKPNPVAPPQTSEVNALPRHPTLPHQPNAEQSNDGAGFLQERREEMSSVNTVQPPDLVPYEETFNSPMRSLPEATQPTSEVAIQSNESRVESSNGNDAHEAMLGDSHNAQQETEKSEDAEAKKEISEKIEPLIKIESPEPCSSSSLDKPETGHTEATGGTSSRNSIVKSNSGSDSDGGDIDTIVQEFKEDNIEEADIDDLVKEFIDEHPEAVVASPKPEQEMTRQSSLGFNKFGRVLNKMQSVTKYMNKKKTIDETSKSPSVKSKIGRRSRTTSQTDGDEASSDATSAAGQHQQRDDENEAEDKTEGKTDDPDPFELLSKAAEVFKARTVNKKKSPRRKAPRVWRSMTVDTDVADLEDNEDCDLVTRAAVLFKGFKGKRALRIERSMPLQPASESNHNERDITEEAGSETLKEENITEEKEEDAAGKSLAGETFSNAREDGTEKARETGGTKLPIIAPVSASPQEHCDGAMGLFNEDKAADGNIDTDTTTEMEESISKMDDSGFESSIRYATESSVRSDDDDDDTDGPGKVSSLLDSVREHAVFSVVEVTTPEISTYESMTCKLGASIQDYVEKCMLASTQKIDVHERCKTDVVTGDGIIINDVEWPETSQEKSSTLKDTSDMEHDGISVEQKGDYRMVTSDITDDQSVATDSGLETEIKTEQENPRDARPVSQTCDLILSTGYDDTKVTKLKSVDSSEGNASVIVTHDAREETNGKLEELTKEILAVEAASYEGVASKPEVNRLNITSPEYQRLSSDSSENPDSNSLTVNLPDSPENGMSLSGDGPFSLCCGANFKINLNCTAMMKKPERRPSKVVIENKRCAMTEEEKIFPLKVSSSFRDNFDKGNPPDGDQMEKPKTEDGTTSVTKPTSNTLKVNEHERNRNFAGSREELIDQRKGSKSKDATKESGNSTDNTKEDDKKRQKQRSLVEEPDKDKNAVQNYETVLNELSKKQEAVVSGEGFVIKDKTAGASDAQERRERARAKRYGRVISESEFDDGLLPTSPGDLIKTQQDSSSNTAAGKTSPTTTTKNEKDQKEDNSTDATNAQVIVSSQPPSSVVTSEPVIQAVHAVQRSMDVYDNIRSSDNAGKSGDDIPPPVPIREPRKYKTQGRNYQQGYRHHTASLGSVSSVVSDEGGRQGIRADIYLKARRAYLAQPHGKTKWVSSTPHLSAIERGGDANVAPPKGARHSSFPHLHANSDMDVSAPACHQYNYKTHNRVHSDGSGSSFGSESVCWGNYARVADLQLQERAPSCDDSESSTSGLFIPGGGGGIPSVCGRASTLSDVSDGYIFGDYSTVKDDIQNEESRGVIRPLDNQNQQADYSFRFRHFPEDNPHVHYENIEDLVVTTQPMGGPRHWASGPDIYCDNNYAVIGDPHHYVSGHPTSIQPPVSMSSIGVQMSGSPSLARQAGPTRVSHCASQTSLDSLIGLVSHDASDILEGLPVYEFTLGAGAESEEENSEGHSLSAAASTQCPDLGQPDVTRQTASLDRHQLRYKKQKSWEAARFNNEPGNNQHGVGFDQSGHVRGRGETAQNKRKETRVTFSRDAVLTEVIDELRKSEAADQDLYQDQLDNTGVVSGGRGLRGIAASTLTSIGGGVKEFARMINSPFHCCRSGRAEPRERERPKVGGPVVL